MKVLLTGAPGMLGKAVTVRIHTRHRVIGVSKTGRGGALAADLADEKAVDALFRDAKPDAVVHTAAYSDVDGCERDPGQAHRSNAVATKILMGHCASRALPFVHVSTDYVFDGRKKEDYSEADTTRPVNVYGLTKLEAEVYAAQAPFSAIVRTSWLFGADNPSNFVNAIVARLKSADVVRVLADQEDSPTYVGDLAEALEKILGRLLEAKASGVARQADLFHFCNAGSTTRLEMTRHIRDCMGLKIAIEETSPKDVPNRLALRPDRPVLSTRHYERTFGTKIRGWRESLTDYLKRESLCAC